MIIIGIIIIVIAVVAVFVYNPAGDLDESRISILNNNTIGENGTIYVKLTDKNSESLSGKNVQITVSDQNGTVIFNETAKTHMTGVAVVKLTNISDGVYKINATFAGDENYTGCGVSKKITIGEGIVEEDLGNVTDIVGDDTSLSQSGDSQQSQSSYQSSSASQSSYQSSSSSRSSSSSSSGSSSGGSSDTVYDENGKVMQPVIDENGKETYEY